MVKCLKIPLKSAEQIRNKLDKYITYDYAPEKGRKYIYFALNEIPNELPKEIKIVDKQLKKRIQKPKNIKEILSKIMNEKELDELVSSFEVLNDIAIIEIPNQLNKYEKQIAEAVRKMHGNIKTVLKKETGMEGEFRIRNVSVILGENKTITTYKENGCIFKLDIAKMFYSTKLSTDRKRITQLVKENTKTENKTKKEKKTKKGNEKSDKNIENKQENILVPFAGYGPFAITIAKYNPNCDIVGIELNSDAVEYFKENIKLNKLNNCKALLGDASKIVEEYPEYKQWADRIVMPIPKNALDFLPDVLKCAKKDTILHIYAFDEKEHPFERKIKIIETIAKKQGFNIKLLNKKIVRPYAPNVFQICLDIQLH
ncbi:MAG: class I SAM-dependent methyltransferase family protein [Candidatus Micrarchaeia archaeon]|jgi:tRNA (guanine37-N1)-methyltransferase